MRKKPRYIIMNGTIGCLPDNTDYADSLAAAIQQVDSLFDGLPRGAKNILRKYRVYYFGPKSHEYGAEYVEIADNDEGLTWAEIEKGI